MPPTAASMWTRALLPAAAAARSRTCCAVAQILKGKNCGAGEFRISVYPDSMPTYLELVKNGAVADIVVGRRHFPRVLLRALLRRRRRPRQRRRSPSATPPATSPTGKAPSPARARSPAVALMDARSIAATAANGGVLTAATEILDEPLPMPAYHFDDERLQEARLQRLGQARARARAQASAPTSRTGRSMPALQRRTCCSRWLSYITDPVTTTDELIPSGETSSYRSNPLQSGGVCPVPQGSPAMWAAPKQSQALDDGAVPAAMPGERPSGAMSAAMAGSRRCRKAHRPRLLRSSPTSPATVPPGSRRPPASGCWAAAANFATEYATKRYRSNCINWGMLPFLVEDPAVVAGWAITSLSPASAKLCWRPRLR